MAITFDCPNGHKLSCPDDRAGRGGKCPKCGAMFQVPTPAGAVAPGSDTHVSDSQITEPSGTKLGAAAGTKIGSGGNPGLAGGSTPSLAGGSPPSLAGGSPPPLSEVASRSGLSKIPQLDAGATATAEPAPVSGSQVGKTAANGEGSTQTVNGAPLPKDHIVFLCPNGHKLNGPSSLQGRPGKCPHCGATFLIPDYNQIVVAEGHEVLESLEEHILGEDEQAEEEEEHQEIVIPDHDRAAYLNGLADGDSRLHFAGLENDNAAAYSDHAMGRLFNELWQSRGNGIIEIYLKGGNVVSPDWFAPDHSQESCGMFGLQDADGSYTLTAIRWDAMERISIRGLEDFPDGMFH